MSGALRRARAGAVAIGAVVLLIACSPAQQQADEASARTAASEDAARQATSAFDGAVASSNWAMAKAQGDVLLMQYPGTQAARRVQGQMVSVRVKADALREADRAAALWNYNALPVKGGIQHSAAIDSTTGVDVDGSGAKPVQLVFRDHPAWGRSAYLVLKAGDFACYGGCKVKVAVDAAAPQSMSASRPKTDEAIAMFIQDDHALWRMTRGARRMTIGFPVKAGGTRTAAFDVGGLDRTQMPGWD